jgi:hypothetical protein
MRAFILPKMPIKFDLIQPQMPCLPSLNTDLLNKCRWKHKKFDLKVKLLSI